MKSGKSNRAPSDRNGVRRNPPIGVRRSGGGNNNTVGGAGGSSWRTGSTVAGGASNHGASLNYRPSTAANSKSVAGANKIAAPASGSGVTGGRGSMQSGGNISRGGHGQADSKSSPHGKVVDAGGGQVQLQRQAPPTQRQSNSVPAVSVTPQQKQQQQIQSQAQNETLQQGLVSMDEVMNDIRILEQQQRDSHRMLESIKLTKAHKLEQKSSLETKLSNLRFRNAEFRTELARANKQLSLSHRELLEAKSRSEASRKATNRFDAKLKRAIGVARVLGAYQNKIESAMIALNETEARLNFFKGRVMGKLNAAMVRRDETKHRHCLLLKAIHTNQQKERAILEDISKVRSEIAGYESDLSSAQKMESQTKLRVETIEHEIVMERKRHEETLANLKIKSQEVERSKATTIESIQEKKALVEGKKAQLSKVWNQCYKIRKAEGHYTPEEPQWGVDQVPSLDVSRIRLRVNAEEENLNSKKTEKDKLKGQVENAKARIQSYREEAAEKHEQATSICKNAERDRSTEILRKENIQKAIAEADLEFLEVERLRNSIKKLTATQEKSAEDLKSKEYMHEKSIASLEDEISETLAAITEMEETVAEFKDNCAKREEKVAIEIETAKKHSDHVRIAFENAQKRAHEFACVPDNELQIQMKELDSQEKEIIDDAEHKMAVLIEEEPILNKMIFDYDSVTPLNDQAMANLDMVRELCLERVEQAKSERRDRVKQAKEAHYARIKAEEEALRIAKEEDERRRIEEENRQEEARIAAEELERKNQEAKRRAAEEAEAKRRLAEIEAEKRRKIEEEKARKLEEERLMKLEEERERKRRIEEEAAAAEKRREDEKKMRLVREEEERRRQEEARAEKRRALQAALEEEYRRKKDVEAQERRARRATEVEKQRKRREAEEEERRERVRIEEEERKEKLRIEEEQRLERLRIEEEERRERVRIDEEEQRREKKAAEKAERLERKRMEEERRRAKKEAEKAEQLENKRAEEERRRAKKAAEEAKRLKKKQLEKEQHELKKRAEKLERRAKRGEEERRRQAGQKAEEDERRAINEEEEKPRVKKRADNYNKRRASKEAEIEQNRKDEPLAKMERRRELEQMRERSKEMNRRLDEEDDLREDIQMQKTMDRVESNKKASAKLKRNEDEKALRAAIVAEKRAARKEHNATTYLDSSRHRSTGKHKRSGSVEERGENLLGGYADYAFEGSPRSLSTLKKPRLTNSYNEMEAEKLKMKSTCDESGKDALWSSSNKYKQAADYMSKGAPKRSSSHTQSILSVPSQSAIKQKDSKRVKTSSSVRFDQSASRPKLDIFSSGVHKGEEKKKSSKSGKQSTSKLTSTQSSGISSCEGLGGRRRKKVQGKSKSKSIGLQGLDDDGAFL